MRHEHLYAIVAQSKLFPGQQCQKVTELECYWKNFRRLIQSYVCWPVAEKQVETRWIIYAITLGASADIFAHNHHRCARRSTSGVKRFNTAQALNELSVASDVAVCCVHALVAQLCRHRPMVAVCKARCLRWTILSYECYSIIICIVKAFQFNPSLTTLRWRLCPMPGRP